MKILDKFCLVSICVLAACAAFFSSAPHALAFDGLQYIASYGDLITAFGPDAAMGERHYQLYGQQEGRQPDAFDEVQYLANYADLRAAFGADSVAATVHYIRSGFAEGRTDHAGPPACPARAACGERVTSGAQLAGALGSVGCGCEIVLADGVYEGDFVLDRLCPAGQPLVVRAEHLLHAAIHAGFTLSGDNDAVVGLQFEGLDATLRVGGTGNQVLRNRFAGWRGVAVQGIDGRGAEIGYNELSSPAPWSKGGKDRKGISSYLLGGGFQHDAHVFGNYFHDFPGKPIATDYNSGQSDALEICGGRQPISTDPSGWVIERNLVERHHEAGAAVIDIKCSGTTVRFNTLLDSPGARLDLRSGSGSTLAGNWLERTGGSVVHGGSHRLIGNMLIQSSGIVLIAGNVPFDYTGPTVLPGLGDAHQAAAGAWLSGNVAPWIAVGKVYRKNFVYAAHDNTIEQFAGSVRYGFQYNTNVAALASSYVPVAIRQTPGSVGPYAWGGCP